MSEQYVCVDVSNPWRVTVARPCQRWSDAFRTLGSVEARKAVALVNDTLPLRTCRRSFMDKRSYGSPCLELSLNRCLGPCIGQADPELYREYVYDVLEFFRGDDRRLIKRLHTKLEDTVASLDFERAATSRPHQAGRNAARGSGLDVWHSIGRRCCAAGHCDRNANRVVPAHPVGAGETTVNDDETARDLAVRFEPIHQRATLPPTASCPITAVDEMAGPVDAAHSESQAYIPLTTERLMTAASRYGVDLSVPFGEGSGGEEADDTGATEYDSVATVCTDTSASLGVIWQLSKSRSGFSMKSQQWCEPVRAVSYVGAYERGSWPRRC